MITPKQIALEFKTRQQIKDLEKAITTITTLQGELDILTDSEESGDLLDKALRPIRTKIFDLRVELEQANTLVRVVLPF